MASIDGVDVLFVGPMDLSMALGIFGQFDHPEYMCAIKATAEAAKKANKTCGVLLTNPDQLTMYYELGYRFFTSGADTGFINAGARNTVKILNEIILKMGVETRSVKSKASAGQLRWWLLGLPVLAMVISYIDRGNISMVIPLITDLLKLSPEKKGYIFSAFLFEYALMQIPSGIIVDRFGFKWTYAIAFFVWCLTAAAFGLATVFWHFIMLRILLGFWESVSGPAGNELPVIIFLII